MLGKIPFAPEPSLLKNKARILLLALTLLPACAKEKEANREVVSERVQVLEGSLEANLLKVHADDWQDPCEEKLESGQLEVARALDARKGQIEEFVRNNPSGISANRRLVQVGKLMVAEFLDSPATVSEWKSQSLSWGEIITEFAQIKNQPVNSDWVWLNNYARGILVNDVNRVNYGQNFSLDKDSGPRMELLANVIRDCLNQPACDEVVIPDSLQTFMSAQPNYRNYIRWAKAKDSREEKRKTIERFQKYVAEDIEWKGFHKNAAMRKLGPNKYELDVDAGPLADVATSIQRYVENIWRGSDSQVSIRWRQPSPDVFKIFVGSIFGERASVSFTSKLIKLHPGVSNRSIAHEFGHVMGFSDNYYEIWQPESCGYASWANDGDIMSNSSKGVVLPEHWAELSRQYE